MQILIEDAEAAVRLLRRAGMQFSPGYGNPTLPLERPVIDDKFDRFLELADRLADAVYEQELALGMGVDYVAGVDIDAPEHWGTALTRRITQRLRERSGKDVNRILACVRYAGSDGRLRQWSVRGNAHSIRDRRGLFVTPIFGSDIEGKLIVRVLKSALSAKNQGERPTPEQAPLLVAGIAAPALRHREKYLRETLLDRVGFVPPVYSFFQGDIIPQGESVDLPEEDLQLAGAA